MDESWEKWISSSLEMGGDNSCGQDSYTNILDGDKFLIDFEPSFSFENDNDNYLSSNSTMQYCNNNNNSGTKMLQRNNSSTTTTTIIPSSQTTYILSFEKSTVEPATHSEIPKGKEGSNKNIRHRRSSCGIQDHIMAERRRRQVLNERFIALSAIIPGLKKTDKAYILREAINYVKQLQERVKELENQNKRKKRDSIISMKKYSQECTNEETIISCEENSNKKGLLLLLPTVEARVLENEILIGIHCEKEKDIVLRLMAMLQNLHLSLAGSSVLPFGSSTLKVTIIAQMEEEYCMNVNDLVKSLKQYLLKESRETIKNSQIKSPIHVDVDF